MSESANTTYLIEGQLARIAAGDDAAVDDVIQVAFARLIDLCERIVGRMVGRGRADIRQSDAFQDVYFRLKGALVKENVKPKTAAEFFGLASRHIRYQVLDMLRKAKRSKQEAAGDTILNLTPDEEGDRNDKFEMWIAFYEAFESLPDDQREVADLLWTWVEGKGGPAVANLTQYEAAEVLGISRDRVKDLWRSAKIHIAKHCREFTPFTPS